jgi:hypothetical protein
LRYLFEDIFQSWKATCHMKGHASVVHINMNLNGIQIEKLRDDTAGPAMKEAIESAIREVCTEASGDAFDSDHMHLEFGEGLDLAASGVTNAPESRTSLV